MMKTVLKLAIAGLALASLTACSSMKPYKDEGIEGPTATLTVKAEAKTFMSRYLIANLWDFEMIHSGEACGQKGLIFKETVIERTAYMGSITASSKREGESFKVPAGPLRLYLDFSEGGGNVIYTNFADIVIDAEQDKEYLIGYKRSGTGSGDYYFMMKQGEEYVPIEQIGRFSASICDEHLNA